MDQPPPPDQEEHDAAHPHLANGVEVFEPEFMEAEDDGDEYAIVDEGGDFAIVGADDVYLGMGQEGGGGGGAPHLLPAHIEDVSDDDMVQTGEGLLHITQLHQGLQGMGSSPSLNQVPSSSASSVATLPDDPANHMPEAVWQALRALDERKASHDLLPLLLAAKEELAEFFFRCPVPKRGRGPLKLNEELRTRALMWLLVLEYVEHEMNAMGGAAHIPEDAMEIVQRVGDMAPHKICQHAFKKNDIVWICKQCQKDETCVLCNNCFRDSCHEGHEVYFYHTQAGGCCDCGDEDAWDATGFCHRHGSHGDDPLSHLPPAFNSSARAVLQRTMAFILSAVEAYVASYDLGLAGTQPWGGPHDDYYLLLHNDDVHTLTEVLQVLERRLMPHHDAREKAEVAHERGEAVLRSGPLPSLMSDAVAMQKGGLLVSLSTRQLSKMLKVALIHLNWLYKLAGVSGGICRLVVEQLNSDVLSRLMVAHARLPKDMVSALHTLYLFLMADQSFKCAVAQSYAGTYLEVTRDYGAGVGMAEFSLYSLSVQFLNRATFVHQLVATKDFLGVLCRALRTMLGQTIQSNDLHLLTTNRASPLDAKINVKDRILQARRYSPLIADLKFVLNIEGVSPRFAATDCLVLWGDVLRMIHYVHSQRRQVGDHVSMEARDWMFAFNVQISVSSVLDCLLSWVRNPAFPTASTLQPPGPSTPQEAGALLLRVGCSIIEWIEEWQTRVYETVGTRRLPVHPIGTVEALNPLPKASFHITLHRFLAFLVRDASKSAVMTEAALQPLLTKLHNNSRLTHGLVEIPLSVLVMTSEIRSGLWKRNGSIMPEQVINYSEPPFCKMFRDMDLLQIQFAGLALGAGPLLNLLLHHFHVYEWLLGPEGQVSASLLEEPPTHDNIPESARCPLAEELLLLLITLLTELPLPPLDPEDRLKRLLRREVVHRLASGPCPHSEIYDCCHQLAEAADNQAEQLLEDVLKEVAVRKEARELEAETFALRDPVWQEYDPAFFHMTVQSHQSASEIRPKPKVPTPLVGPPAPAHPLFSPLRACLLSSPTLLHVLRLVLHKAVQRSPCPRWSDLLLYRCVHLLTLALHTAVSEAHTFAEPFFDQLTRTDTPTPSPYPLGEERGRKRSEAAMEHGSTSPLSAPYTLPPSPPIPSLLSLLLSLPDACRSDPHMFQGVKWLTATAAALDPRCARALESFEKQQAGGGKVADMETRKKQARERALSSMARQAAAFTAASAGLMGRDGAEGIDDEDLDDDFEGLGGGKGPSESRDDPSGAPDCIVCKDRGSDKGPLGYVALCQPSNVLQHCPGSLLHLCSHALHYSCFDEYFATVVESSEAMGHLILNVNAGEFPCPYCKSLSNNLVPYCPPSSPSPSPSPTAKDKEPELVAMEVSPPRAARQEREEKEVQEKEEATKQASNGNGKRAAKPSGQDEDVGVAVRLKRGLSTLLCIEAYLGHKRNYLLPSGGRGQTDDEVNSLRDVCSRFLHTCATSHPSLSSPSALRRHRNLLHRPLAKSLGPYISTCDAVAYTLSLIQSEAGHAVLCPPVGPTNADGPPSSSSTPSSSFEATQLERLCHVTAALRASTQASDELGSRSGYSAACLLLGRCPSVLTLHGDEGDDEAEDDDSPTRQHARRPLLRRNLLGVLVQCLCSQPLLTEVGGKKEAAALLLPLLAVARVVQVVLAQHAEVLHSLVGGGGEEEGKQHADETGTQEEEEAEPAQKPQVLHALTALLPSGSDGEETATALLSLLRAAVDTGKEAQERPASPSIRRVGGQRSLPIFAHFRAPPPTEAHQADEAKPLAAPSTATVTPVDETVQAVAQFVKSALQAFLSASALLLAVLGDDYRPDGYAHPQANASLQDLMALFKVPSLIEVVCRDQGWGQLIRGWTSEGYAGPLDYAAVNFPTGLAKPHFVELKRSYTELHSELTVRAPGEHPTLCLICNAALNAGRRACTMHAAVCGGGTGVFFLLQDCSVLLIYGERACYFASPYVDAYGERHKQFRGRPLFLDARRLEALRRLWATQRVAYEVVHSRSAAKHVIFNGYY